MLRFDESISLKLTALRAAIWCGVLPALLLGVGPTAAVGQETSDLSSPARDLVAGARQHLLVVTESPGDVEGRLFRMEPANGVWRQVGDPIPVVVGRNGIGPKREGDGRSPQGVFELGRAFGYAAEPPPGTLLSYEAQAPGAVCVDDVASDHYNRVFDADTLSTSRDWSSFEAMRRDLAHGDDLYRWGIVVRYNGEGTPGAGSCIFLHVWRAPGSPTSGCTAMSEGDLLDLLGWLDPEHGGGGPEFSAEKAVTDQEAGGKERAGEERTATGRTATGQAGTRKEDTEKTGEETASTSPGAGPILIQGSREYLEGLRREGVLPYPVPVPVQEAGFRARSMAGPDGQRRGG